jgi:hypothetical protein
MVSFILSLLGCLTLGFLCFCLGAITFCVGMGIIYKEEGKVEEYKEILELLKAHKRK